MAGNVLFSALLILCTLLYKEDKHADKVKPSNSYTHAFLPVACAVY